MESRLVEIILLWAVIYAIIHFWIIIFLVLLIVVLNRAFKSEIIIINQWVCVSITLRSVTRGIHRPGRAVPWDLILIILNDLIIGCNTQKWRCMIRSNRVWNIEGIFMLFVYLGLILLWFSRLKCFQNAQLFWLLRGLISYFTFHVSLIVQFSSDYWINSI